MNPPECESLAAPAAALCRRTELIDPGETIVGTGDLGLLEHLIHEVAHAATLGLIPFNPPLTSRAIGATLSMEPDDGIENESQTWAIEWFVWQLLGMSTDDRFTWRDLEVAAEVQGCDPERIAFLVDAANTESDRYLDLAHTVVREIRRLTKP